MAKNPNAKPRAKAKASKPMPKRTKELPVAKATPDLSVKPVVYGKFNPENTPVTVTMTPAQLTRAITAIGNSGAKLDEQIHTVAIQAMLHARDTGDVRPLTRLFYAIPKSGRALTFKTWVCDFMPAVWVKEEAKGTLREHFRLKANHEPDQFKIVEAARTPYWVRYKEPEVVDVSIELFRRRLESLCKYILTNLGKLPEAEREEARRMETRLLGTLPKEDREKVLNAVAKSEAAKAPEGVTIQ